MGPQRMFGMTPWVRRILVANVVVYLLQQTIFSDTLFFDTLGFNPLLATDHPWSFLTYMFVHAGMLHIAFNLLALYVFGPPVEERLGARAFLGFYLICGLGGAVLSYALMLMVKVGVVVGASGAIYGIMVAFAWYWPNEPIFVFPLPEPVKAKWLVAFAIGLSLLLAAIGMSPGTAHLAHLGGAGAAFLWLKLNDWQWGRAEKRLRGGTSIPGVLVHPAVRAARGSDPVAKPRPAAPDRTHAEIDRVLDKISARGIGSLTPAEKKFLAEMSKKMPPRN
jgi:membrane associated rhomboid family serine protease